MHLKQGFADIGLEHASLFDRWILSRLNKTANAVEDALDNYRFNEAAGVLYQFVWHEFCDWHLEAVKPVLYGEKGEEKKNAALSVLWHVVRETLILLHPFIPFVTEEIWDKLPGTQGSIMRAGWLSDREPDHGRKIDEAAESDMALIIEIITGIRNIRGEMNISPSIALNVVIDCREEGAKNLLISQQEALCALARLNSVNIRTSGERLKSAAFSIVSGATIWVLLEGVIDFEKEIERLEKESGKIAKELTQITKKLNNADFLAKAPEDVKEKVKEKEKDFLEKQRKLHANLDKIRALA
jgi:valyl-tRNA synthetase